MQTTDGIHFGLMLGALALAYVLPFELLLLSYAILGPAHYFTEISWLHDRKFFLPHRALLIIPLIFGVAALYFVDAYWSGVLLWCVFLWSAILAVTPQSRRAALFCVAGGAVTALMIASQVNFAIAGVLLPTFIHVCVFTLAFMTLGAWRSKSPVQFALVGLYLAAVVLILVVPPTAATTISALAQLGSTYFGSVAPAFGALLGIPDLYFEGRVTGLLSFVYTYHYLNWFIKADVIRWNAIPRLRLAAIVALSAASTGLYFYNYEMGLLVLLAISFAHVLLEFPLNGLSFYQLGALAFGRRVTHSAA